MANDNNFLNWDWSTQHVGADLNNGEYVTVESTVILAGPSRLELVVNNATSAAAGRNTNVPLILIGKSAQFDFNETKTVSPIFEIGAKRAYMLSEKSTYMGNVAGFLAYKESLLKLMYSGWTITEDGYATNNYEQESVMENGVFRNATSPVRIPIKNDKPGYNMHYNALSSKLFTAPIGLCIIHRSNRDNSYSAIYLEDVVVDAYHIGMTASQAVLIETIRFMCGFVKPINVNAFIASN